MITDSRPIWDAPLAEILSQLATSNTRASATDIPGVNLEWMATDAYPQGAWFGDCGQPTLAQLNALPTAYLAIGARASVLGDPYTYRGGGVGWKPSGLPAYADYATLSLQTPTVGRIAQIPRLCGNGYFALRANGTRWEVCPGESIVRDAGPASAGYDLTATGTTYVALASYTIPAGMIGDGEEWEFDIHAMSLEIHASGSNYVDAYVGGTKLLGTAPMLSAVNQVARKRGAFVRLNNTLAMRAGTVSADLYSAVSNNDAVVDVSTQQEVTAGFAPGAVTNKMRLRHICLRRIG